MSTCQNQVSVSSSECTADFLAALTVEAHAYEQVIQRVRHVGTFTGIARQSVVVGRMTAAPLAVFLPTFILLERPRQDAGILDCGNEVVVASRFAVDAQRGCLLEGLMRGNNAKNFTACYHATCIARRRYRLHAASSFHGLGLAASYGTRHS